MVAAVSWSVECIVPTVEEDIDRLRTLERDGKEWTRLRDSIVARNMGIVRKLAWSYSKKTALSSEDLMQQGVFGVLRALEKFDTSKKLLFVTYAYGWVNHFIHRYVLRQSCFYYVPLHKQTELRRLAKRDPGTLTEEEKAEVSLFTARRLEIITKDDDDTSATDFDKILYALNKYRSSGFFHVPEVQDYFLIKQVRLALDKLDERERKVILDRDSKTLDEIAKELDLCRERVRQIEESAKNKLRAYLRKVK